MSLPQKLSLISLASPRPNVSLAPSASITTPPTSPRRRHASTQPRPSTDSWSSVEEDQTLYDWTHDQIRVLSAALERAPSNLATPYTGAVPPSNLLDAIAHEIVDARPSKSAWPHSLRSTRLKLIQVAKRQARISENQESARASRGEHHSRTAMDIDRTGMTPGSYHYSNTNMDISPIPEEPSSIPSNYQASLQVPSTPLRSTTAPSSSQKITPHAAFHPYKRTPRSTVAKAGEPSTPPPRNVESLPHPGSVRPERHQLAIPEGPSSLSAASSATLLSSMASQASLSTAIGSGSISGKPTSFTKTPRRGANAKTPRRTRIVEGGELSSNLFGPSLASPQVPVTPGREAAAPATPIAPTSTKRLRSRTVTVVDGAYAADTEMLSPNRGLAKKSRTSHPRSNSISQSQPKTQNPYLSRSTTLSSQPSASIHAEAYAGLRPSEVIRPRVLSNVSSSRGARNLRDNVPPIIATPAVAPQTPPTPVRSSAPTPSYAGENAVPRTPSHRLRRVGQLAMSPTSRSNENNSPMQLSPSPSRRSHMRAKEGGSSRPLSMMSAASDMSERSALSNLSAHSGSIRSSLSALGSRPPPSRAARMIGRKISFGSDPDATGLRFHHGSLGSPGGSGAAGSSQMSVTMMTLAPAFELR